MYDTLYHEIVRRNGDLARRQRVVVYHKEVVVVFPCRELQQNGIYLVFDTSAFIAGVVVQNGVVTHDRLVLENVAAIAFGVLAEAVHRLGDAQRKSLAVGAAVLRAYTAQMEVKSGYPRGYSHENNYRVQYYHTVAYPAHRYGFLWSVRHSFCPS